MPSAISDRANNVYVSETLRSTHSSLPSPDGDFVATITGSHVEIRSLPHLEVVRTIDAISGSDKKDSRYLSFCWYQSNNTSTGLQRFLYATEDSVHVYDVHNAQYSVKIDNGSGGLGKNAHVEFGANPDEILVWSSFGSRLVVWNLLGGRSIEIKDPKLVGRGHGRRGGGKSAIFALLTRQGSQDVISLHAPDSYALVRSIAIPTADAQGLKWSPDGKWFAVWDTPRDGYKVLIYTADGNLFRNYAGDYFDDGLVGLGVRCIEWSANGDFLAVAGYEKTVTLLHTRTFSPAVHLKHPKSIRLPSTMLWQETVETTQTRQYLRPGQPFALPSAAPAEKGDVCRAIGASLVTFNADGSLLATKDDGTPTVVFIWDLQSMTLRSVLVQHSVVKRLKWHPTDHNRLLIQCTQEDTVVYIWDSTQDKPSAVPIPGGRLGVRAEHRWIVSEHRPSAVLVGDPFGSVVAWVDGMPESETSSGSHSEFSFSDGGVEQDADARKTVFDDNPTSATLDDTFQFRREVGVS